MNAVGARKIDSAINRNFDPAAVKQAFGPEQGIPDHVRFIKHSAT
jgi:hypothetical protein